MDSRAQQVQRLRDEALTGRLPRRRILLRAAALGLGGSSIAALLAACSGPDRSNEPELPATLTPVPVDSTSTPAAPEATPVRPTETATIAPEPTATPEPPEPTSEPTHEIERSDTMTAGFVYSERYLDHDPGVWTLPGTAQGFPFSETVAHPSNYRLAQRTSELVNHTGLNQNLVPVEPRMAAVEDLTVYHTAEYVEKVRQISAGGGGDTGTGAPASTESYEVALLAAGGGMAAVDAVTGGTVDRVFVNSRPPGHHAMSDMGMGFCIFNNIVVAARYAQRAHGYGRVMILDWDVHHGNGTQDAFYNDPDVLFVSLHQDQLFPPGLGEIDQTGDGEGEGFTVNLPLPPGSGDAAYLAAFDQIILPIANAFQPELVLISAGQDASAMDQLGRMAVSCEGYRQMTQRMIDLAGTHSGGRLVAMQEGGYSEVYGPYCTLAIIETLAGTRTGIAEPITRDRMLTQPQTTTIGPAGEAALEAIRVQQARFWPV